MKDCMLFVMSKLLKNYDIELETEIVADIEADES